MIVLTLINMQIKMLASTLLFFLKKNTYLSFQNPNAHVRWTSKQILAQKPDINVFCAGMGTSGTMTGTGSALKR